LPGQLTAVIETQQTVLNNSSSAQTYQFDFAISEAFLDLIRNLPQRGSPHELVTH
jgi:hypothetical protein